MRKESLINQEKETIDSNSKRYCFYGRKTGKNIHQAQRFIKELHKHGILYVFNEKELNKFIRKLKDDERAYTCNAIEAQLGVEVFIDEELTSTQINNAIEKVKYGKLQGREWKPTTPLPYEFIMIDEKGETE
jgi:hypothetical protein